MLLKGSRDVSETGSITVSQLNLMIADAIRREPRVRSVTVCGEISGFKHHLASGHWYFSLKDEESSISCVMFRQNTFRARMKPRDGDNVRICGYVDVYPKNGTYQLYAMTLQPDGIGDLYIRFEELKRKLSAEGLFDPARKRMLPMVPRKVAVITSGSGAAWHDIRNVSALRNPSVPIVLIPAGVQGEKAAAEIAEGIRAANEQTDADVLIVARGGGSAEDLWCFNEEIVARAVAGSRIPVVSGVGHEIDTTICDLAADVRASTPSNAAEIVFPDRKELHGRIGKMGAELRRTAETVLSAKRSLLQQTVLRLSSMSPQRRISGLVSGAELGRERLNHAMRIRLENADREILITRGNLVSASVKHRDTAKTRILRIRERLEAINPLSVLERGYSLVTERNGRVLTSASQAKEAGDVLIRFANGTAEAVIRKDGVQSHG